MDKLGKILFHHQPLTIPMPQPLNDPTLFVLFQSDGEKLCKELELCTSGGNGKYVEPLLVKKLKAHPYILALKSVKVSECQISRSSGIIMLEAF